MAHGLVTSPDISVASMMDGQFSARPRLKLVGDGVHCPTTREPCPRGCTTICLLPADERKPELVRREIRPRRHQPRFGRAAREDK